MQIAEITAWRGRIRPLNDYLVLFVLGLIVPLLAFSGFVLLRYSQGERIRADSAALENAQSIANNIDREIDGWIAVLQTLALSSQLAEGDLRQFYNQAKVASEIIGLPIVLRDTKGAQLLNTRVEWGTPLPQSSNVGLHDQVLATRTPYVSDLVMGAMVRRPVAALLVPVVIADNIPYVLVLSVEPNRVLQVLLDQDLPSHWTSAVTDRQGIILARSRDQADYIGRSNTLAVESLGLQGVRRTYDFSGNAIVRGYRRAKHGWLISVFARTAVIDAPLKRSWLYFIAAGIGALGISLPLAVFFGRRISAPIQSVAGAAAALGRGEDVPVIRSQIREMDDVGKAIARAGAALRERTKAVAESEERFRAVFEQAAVGFEQIDLHGRRVAVNDRLCQMLGYTREECLALTPEGMTHPEDLASEQVLIERMMKDEVPNYVVEKRLKHKNGEDIWVRVTSSLIRTPSAEDYYRISVVEDVTQRRQARLAAARLAAVVQSSSDAMLSVSIPGDIIETWNPAAERLFGYREDEVVGKSKAMLIPPEFQHEIPGWIARLAAGESTRVESIRVHKDGTRLQVAVSAAPIRVAGSDSITAASVTVEDISERKQWERQLLLLNREFAHRLKNSLAVIQSIANQTVRATPQPEEFRVAFQGRLQALAAANDLLLESSWSGADLGDFLLSQLKPLLSDSGHQLRMSGDAVVMPSGLSVPLGLAIHELGTNALKYGALSRPEGYVDLSWTVKQSDDDPRLVLVWREVGGAPTSPPTRRGFGSTLIDRGIPNARVTREFGPSGLVCTIDAPLHTEPPRSA